MEQLTNLRSSLRAKLADIAHTESFLIIFKSITCNTKSKAAKKSGSRSVSYLEHVSNQQCISTNVVWNQKKNYKKKTSARTEQNSIHIRQSQIHKPGVTKRYIHIHRQLLFVLDVANVKMNQCLISFVFFTVN